MSNDLQVGEMSVGTCVFEMIGAMGGKEPPSGLLSGQMPRRAAVHSPSFCPSNRVAHRSHNQQKTLFRHNQWVELPQLLTWVKNSENDHGWTCCLALKLELDPTIDLIVNTYKYNRKTIPML